ncbi:polyhydroxyalkanoic acid system family protein [Limnohabitans sp. Rim8]|uniref:polyhydroxyalkanoic acid system family protein n=1 Tax=Limnohabitans sp. Rim8 TaxID=1100718 RepID=UPI0026149E8B|nr:polyhydroxyalkanoic acid system family protein [Limnohabitans sp. Rim8]
MADIEIHRPHGLDLARAQGLAQEWLAQAQNDWGMLCTHSTLSGQDTVTFERVGAKGVLRVDATHFDMQISLGFLLRAYKKKIEDTINRNLDEALGRLA